MKNSRKRYSSTEKVKILRKHLIDHIAVSDICDEFGLHPTQFYRWQKAFFENGAAAFDKKQKTEQQHKDLKIKQLEERIGQKNEVMAELMEEHIKLKKNLGEI